MSPSVTRNPPPYVQITDHFRDLIVRGVLAEGERLPSIPDIAEEFEVAHGTAAKAVTQLQVEGLVRTSPRGTFVEARTRAASPRDRVLSPRDAGADQPTGEEVRVTAAAVVPAPAYVADLFGGDLGEPAEVLRREWVTTEETTARGVVTVSLSVSWHPAVLADADAEPGMLSTEPASVSGVAAAVERELGPVRHCRDFVEARAADAREAGHLGIPTGSAVLAGTSLRWTGGEGGRLAEYLEFVMPPRRVLSWDYGVDAS